MANRRLRDSYNDDQEKLNSYQAELDDEKEKASTKAIAIFNMHERMTLLNSR